MAEKALETIRSLVQPLTHNLPAPVTDVGRSLLGPFCYKTLVLDIDPFTSPDCVKLAVSKGLGIGIIGASSIVKVPQLIKLLNSQSAEGISFLSYLLESGSYLISLSYNIRHGFPFSTYGETALILVQNIVIASLVLKYSGKSAGIAAWVAGLAAAGGALFREDIVDVKTLAWLQAGAGVLGASSKLPQIFTIWQEGGTGQLSAFAVINYLLGSLSRIFTTLQEVPDPLILYGFIAGFALNAVLFLQLIWYWNAPASKKTESKKLNRPIAADKDASGNSTSYASKAKSPSTRRRG
ncbi:monosaccharide-P-dolichol utilization protein [Lophiotrema nucula]|uniref:Mannose-P-dolichol utilization defect 1 protein homolog n=1 Tax=Lophiotrema nucula TaxID=690887 RepID=A0A6A5YQC0_9PLEO|nr:monosaccharide-P-dolichol utilization protein [Lophiotrema nucula]